MLYDTSNELSSWITPWRRTIRTRQLERKESQQTNTDVSVVGSREEISTSSRKLHHKRSSDYDLSKDDDPPNESVTHEDGFVNKAWIRWSAFYSKYRIILLLIANICLAKAYPPLGAEYLYPQITAAWIAVCFIFFCSGLALETKEFFNAGKQVKFNFAIQFYNFVVVSYAVYGISTVLVYAGALSEAMAKGMVICAALPSTTNSVTVLTKAAGGDEAAAIFNSAFGNMLGVFLSPVLILFLVGISSKSLLIIVFLKLALRVLVPVLVGQILRRFRCVVRFVKKHIVFFRRAQIYAMIYISYSVFCRTFSKNEETDYVEVLVLIGATFVTYLGLMGFIWYLLGGLFPNQPRLRVMGFFGGTLKTIAFGVPLIDAMYEADPKIALYTFPLLVAYPIQLFVGSFFAPYLKNYAEAECSRLGINNDDDDGEDSCDGNSFYKGEEESRYSTKATNVLSRFSFSSLRASELHDDHSVSDTTSDDANDSAEKGVKPKRRDFSKTEYKLKGARLKAQRTKTNDLLLPPVVLKECILPENGGSENKVAHERNRKVNVQHGRETNDEEIDKSSHSKSGKQFDDCAEGPLPNDGKVSNSKALSIKMPPSCEANGDNVEASNGDTTDDSIPRPTYLLGRSASMASSFVRRKSPSLGRMAPTQEASLVDTKSTSLRGITSLGETSLRSISMTRPSLVGPKSYPADHSTDTNQSSITSNPSTNFARSQSLTSPSLVRSDSISIGHRISMTGQTQEISCASFSLDHDKTQSD